MVHKILQKIETRADNCFSEILNDTPLTPLLRFLHMYMSGASFLGYLGHLIWAWSRLSNFVRPLYLIVTVWVCLICPRQQGDTGIPHGGPVTAASKLPVSRLWAFSRDTHWANRLLSIPQRYIRDTRDGDNRLSLLKISHILGSATPMWVFKLVNINNLGVITRVASFMQ
jgi:hypothetical protein